ncbi:ShlB/FhaC/HecB family hemolysin secretion/activation protein [Paraburkholderia sediminicola]|uniref:ShlB/FhaC/HecB family hemolysin secretion/activation protein n=1 Tax=Paraburkholderia sediminicola TaxID=458836 RepID=UPI0038B7AF5C
MKRRLMQCLSGMALIAAAASAFADDGFTITRFEVEGNSLLPANEVQRLLQPMSGPHRVYGDIQHALEALENAYRKAGYTAVQVYVPEQELTSGVARLQVTENRIGKITVTGNQHFSKKNVLAGLPQLQSGQSPNLRAISESVQLSNDNPAKQVGVTLESGSEPGTVDAEVKVVDDNPLHIFATIDNTGAASTGRWRTGVAIQDANLFGLDQVGTLAYTTSPDSPGGVRVNVYSVGYRIPLYSLGDNLDFFYGKSSINTPSSSPTLGGLLGLTGKGDIYGFRWNHFFARRGETTSKLIRQQLRHADLLRAVPFAGWDAADKSAGYLYPNVGDKLCCTFRPRQQYPARDIPSCPRQRDQQRRRPADDQGCLQQLGIGLVTCHGGIGEHHLYGHRRESVGQRLFLVYRLLPNGHRQRHRGCGRTPVAWLLRRCRYGQQHHVQRWLQSVHVGRHA